jgi:general secretion pathway protein G
MVFRCASRLKGFSYIELILAVTILALLATAATPFLEKTIQRTKETELRENLREIRKAIDAYKAASDQGKIARLLGDSGYPKRLEDLEDGVENISDPQKKKLRFIRKIPADPMYEQDTKKGMLVAPADTWGKRSYESDANDPREGGDVFDVYSRNPAAGLNGVPYAQW